MEINFDHETPTGVVKFKGSLSPDEVTALLRFAILTLFAQGLLPLAIMTPDETAPTLN